MNGPFRYADLLATLNQSVGTGPSWGAECEDLDCTFLVWREGEEIAPHRNTEVDVVMVVIEGEGEITVEGVSQTLGRGAVLVIPKNTTRSIRPTSAAFAYLNVHKRRRRLMPTSLADRPAVASRWTA